MRAMAYKLFSALKGHPLITAFSVLLLFTLPIFHMLMFFWPLIVSTALGVLAVVSFGRQSGEHTTPTAGCSTAESAGRPDIIAFPPYEEKVSNVLMVGNQEVTWLEWLHNEDTQKLCARECEPAVWDAHGCEISSMAGDASFGAPASRDEGNLSVHANGSTCKDEAIDDASLWANDKGGIYVCGLRGEGETPVSTLVSTEENETRASILITKDETNPDTTGEDRMCRFGLSGAENATEQNGIIFTGNEESNVHPRACAEGDEGLISVDEACLTGGVGDECKTMQGLLDSALHNKNEGNGYASAGGDNVVYTSKPKFELTLEQDASDLPSSSKPISPLIEMKSAKVHEMRHVDEKNEEERASIKQLVTRDPQWDVSDGEEDQSSLRFSFFHNSSFTPTVA